MTHNPADDEYSGIAKWYDPVLTLPMLGARRYIRRLVRRLEPQKVVDVACGTGQQLRMVQGLANELIGIDISPAMLDVARKKESADIVYLESDSRSLPLESSSVDCALISMVLHEMSPELRASTVAEMKRILATGGRLIIADYCQLSGPLPKAMSWLVRFVEKQTEGDHYRNYRQWMQTGALEQFLAEVGLSVEKTRRFMLGNISVCQCRV